MQQGLSGETITEDADLTIAVHRQGYKVRYQPLAKSYTEAPTKVGTFMRQRLRWTFGMLQVSWKHRRAVREFRSVGVVSIVDAIWYQLVTSLIYPFIDLVLLLAILQALLMIVTEGYVYEMTLPIVGSSAYLMLALFDFVNVGVAMLFARRFDISLFLAAPLIRFGYRQMLYISQIRAIFAALTGRLAAWDKLEREGTATMDA